MASGDPVPPAPPPSAPGVHFEQGRAGDDLTMAVLAASRALVAVAAHSLAGLDEDVTLPQYRALVVLTTRGPQRLADLATALHVDPSTATRMCDRLVRKGLVHRRRTSDDRRGVRISLAAPGRELVDEVAARRRTGIADILSRLPDERAATVLAAMNDFAQASGEPSGDDWALGWATAQDKGGDRRDE